MAIESLETRILNYAGEALLADLGLTNTMLEQMVNGGVRVIIGMLPPNMKDVFIKKTAFAPTDGIAVSEADIVRVMRKDADDNFRECRRVDPGKRSEVLDSGSIHFSTLMFSAYWLDAQTNVGVKVKVAPVSTEATDAELHVLGFPTVNIDSDTSITGFPTELEEPLIMYTVVQVKLREAGLSRRDSQTELEAITDSGILAAFDTALPAFVVSSPLNLPTLVLPVMTAFPVLSLTSIGSFSSAPTMDSLPTLVLPTVPSLPSIELIPMSGLPSDLSETNIDTSGIATPVLTLPTPPEIDSLTLPAPPEFTDLDLSGISTPSATLGYVPPSPGPTASLTLTETIPTYSAPSFTFSSTIIDAAILNAKNILDSVGSSVLTDDVFNKLDSSEVEDAGHRLNAHASEVNRANTEVQHQLGLLRQYEAKIGEAASAVNAGVAEFSADLNNQVADAQASVNAYVSKAQDARNSLEEQVQQYIQDISSYANQVSATVQEWTAEEVQFKLQKYQAESTLKIQALGAKSSADMAKYGTELQGTIQKYNNDLALYAQDIRTIIETYMSERGMDVNIYRANYEKAITEFTSRNQAAAQKFGAETSGVISLYGTEVQAVVSKYAEDIQSIVSSFSAKVGLYSTEVNRVLGVFAATVQSETQEYQVKVGSYIGEYTPKANVVLQEYGIDSNRELSRYNSEIQQETVSFQADLNRALAILQKVQARLGVAQSYDNKGIAAANEVGLFFGMFKDQMNSFLVGRT